MMFSNPSSYLYPVLEHGHARRVVPGHKSINLPNEMVRFYDVMILVLVCSVDMDVVPATANNNVSSIKNKNVQSVGLLKSDHILVPKAKYTNTITTGEPQSFV